MEHKKQSEISIQNSPFLKAALTYVQQYGWKIFPLYGVQNGQCYCGKSTCHSPGKHPLTLHGLKDATTDEAIIKNWWEIWPNANIGIATGTVSGFVVLDVDPRHGGEEALTDLESLHEKLPNTVESLTGGKGRHLFFKHPGGWIKNSTSRLGKGLDIRGDGGYIVAPPSQHISGNAYAWEVSGHPSEIEMAPAPIWLLTQLNNSNRSKDSSKRSNPPDWVIENLRELKEGNRNNNFSKLIGRFHYDGYSEEEILEILTPHAERVNFSLNELRLETEGICRRYPSVKNTRESQDTFYSSYAFYAPSIDKNWPILEKEALYGLAGDIVKAIDPYTEADPVAVLTNLLVAFGNCIGAIAYFPVGHTRHYPRIFVGQVGESSKGRKGTGWSPIRYLIEQIDKSWAIDRIVNGLSSGEGLIYQVRDERWKKKARKKKERVELEEELEDQGVEDKRLLVVEEELASSLKVMCREGNTLSPIIRSAWDQGDLKSLVKNNPIKATNAHISIVGHITIHELNRNLNETEKSNGFANRFIWVSVKRSKILPNPLPIPQEIIDPIIIRLEKAFHAAKNIGQMKRDDEAEAVWREVYGPLSEGKPGLLGSILSRAEAQVARLSALYALLDSSKIITLNHLKAALALWDYSESSAKIIFGDKLGDPTADYILKALRERSEMSETDLYNLFGRHKSSSEIQRALNFLEQLELVSKHEESTGGRPKKIWRAA